MLTALVLLPSAGAVLVLLGRRWSTDAGERLRVATGFAFATLAVALLAWVQLAITGAPLTARWTWLAPVGAPVELSADRLSLGFVLLSAVAAAVATLLHRADDSTRSNAMLAGVLAVSAAANICFTADDVVTFVAGWEAVALIAAALVAGGDDGRGAAIAAARRMTVFLFTGGLGVLLAAARLVVLQHAATGEWSYAFRDITAIDIPPVTQPWIAVALLAGCMVRMPIVPLHGWLPPVVAVATPSTAILVVSVVVQTGTYGLLRIVWPIVPAALTTFAPVLVWIAIMALVYAGIGALVQTELRRLVAWLAIGGAAFGLAGLAAAALETTAVAPRASAAFAVGQGMALAALVAAAGLFEIRRGAMRHREVGGAAVVMPRWGALLGGAALAAMAAPLSPAFPALVVLLYAIVDAPVIAAGWARVVVIVGLALWPIALLWPVAGAWGRRPIDRNRGLRDLAPRELVAAVLIGAAIVVPGLVALWSQGWSGAGAGRGATGVVTGQAARP